MAFQKGVSGDARVVSGGPSGFLRIPGALRGVSRRFQRPMGHFRSPMGFQRRSRIVSCDLLKMDLGWFHVT